MEIRQKVNISFDTYNSFDTKLPPFRILFQREINSVCLQIAVAESESAIDAAWFWIERNMMPELEVIDHPFDKEHWVSEKINMIVLATGKICLFDLWQSTTFNFFFFFIAQ